MLTMIEMTDKMHIRPLAAIFISLIVTRKALLDRLHKKSFDSIINANFIISDKSKTEIVESNVDDEKELNAFCFQRKHFGHFRSVSSSVLDFDAKFAFDICESIADFGYLFIENKLLWLFNKFLRIN